MIKNVCLISFILLSFVSCGVILDGGKITGNWELKKTEYYLYNEITDSYITFTGRDTTSDNVPLRSGFFNLNASSVVISFDANGEFTVSGKNKTDGASVFVVHKPSGTWDFDSYENTLSIKVKEEERIEEKEKYDFWSTGISFKNSWPLADLTSMEIIIKNTDLNKDYIKVYNTNYKVKSMKGFFKKI